MTAYGIKDEILLFIGDSAQRNGMEKVILFGSRARGDCTSKSDIDLAISGECPYAFEEDLEERCPTLLKFDFVNLMRDPSKELLANIEREGVTLYG